MAQPFKPNEHPADRLSAAAAELHVLECAIRGLVHGDGEVEADDVDPLWRIARRLSGEAEGIARELAGVAPTA